MKKLASLAAMFVTLVVGAGYLQARTFVLPHVLEKDGGIANTPFSFDTTVYATYTGGLALPSNTAVPGGTGATIDVYLFNNASGAPLLRPDNQQPRCAPCTFTLSSTQRKASILVENLIQTNGGYAFANQVVLGFGVIVVGGADADAVNLQGFVVNSHTSQFDLAVFGFDPQPILATGTTQ